MERMLKLQKIFYILFFICAIFSFIYAISFMTDYQEIFGFELPKNQSIIDFYGKQLQPFNRSILNFSLWLTVGVIILLTFEVMKKVSNFAGLCYGVVLVFYTIIKSALTIHRLRTLKIASSQVDLRYGYLEGLPEDFVMLTRTFDIGRVLYLVLIIITFAFTIIFFINFFLYLQKNHGVKVYFQDLKKQVKGVFNHESRK